MRRASLRSILVATDLSPGSDDVVRAAARLADQVGASFHVVHAVELLGRPFLHLQLGLVQLQAIVYDARERLHEQLGRVVPDKVTTGTVQLDYESAPRAVLRRAKEVGADLIVLGPHRRRVPGGHLLGTTAQRVVEEAGVPCLVTRGPLTHPLRTVLLPVAGIDVPDGLLAAGCQWVAALRRRQAWRSPAGTVPEVRALHVITTASGWRELSGAMTREIRDLSDRPGVGSHLHLRRAVAWSRTPATEIVRVADDVGADLIAMGVRGRGPLLRAILGSVSGAVLRNASAPVLLFPPLARDAWAGPLDDGDAPAWPEVDPLHPAPGFDVGVRDAEAEWHLSYLAADQEDDDELEAASPGPAS